jgi:hypothetical protein
MAVSFIGGGNRSATFNNILVIWWRKLEDPEKTTDPSKVTDKLYPLNIKTLTLLISILVILISPFRGGYPLIRSLYVFHCRKGD